VAQLGARFHGMEEVESSNLSRSTKLSCGKELSVSFFADASTSRASAYLKPASAPLILVSEV
jgi:hypothetical protein